MIDIKPLPYAEDALEPVLSRRAVHAHRLLQERYVSNVRRMAGSRYAAMGVSELVRIARIAHGSGQMDLFNQAAQAWNHEFFWDGLQPYGWPLTQPPFSIAQRYANYDGFVSAAVTESRRLFGSGWLWLAMMRKDGEDVAMWICGPASQCPVQHPLLAIDLWEHSFWIDYADEVGPADDKPRAQRRVATPPPSSARTGRERYVERVLHELVSWDAVASRLP